MHDEDHHILERLEEIARRGDDYLFKPPIEGKPSRAEQMDELLAAVRAGKLGTRVTLWLAGVVAALGAIYSNWNIFK